MYLIIAPTQIKEGYKEQFIESVYRGRPQLRAG
jgi:hypothetical protein